MERREAQDRRFGNRVGRHARLANSLLLGLTISFSALSMRPVDAGWRRGARDLQQVPLYHLVERLRIGGDDDTVLTGIVPDIEVRDSTLFVLQPGAQYVARYDLRGHLLSRFGRKGSGPGEFQMPARAGWFADSLWIYDDGLRRVQLFDRTGKFVRSVQSTWGSAARPLSTSSWLVEPGPTRSPSNSFPILVAENSGRIDTIAHIRIADEGVPVSGSRGLAMRIRLPGQRGVLAVAPSGSHIVIVEEADSPAKSVRVRRFTAAGRLNLDRLVPYEPIRSTRAWYDSSIKETVRATREGSVSEATIRRALPQPKFLAPLQRAVTTRDGGVWIQRMVPPNAPTRFLMLDSAGTLLGEVEGAPSIRILRVERGQAFGTARTDDGTSVIVVFGLKRA